MKNGGWVRALLSTCALSACAGPKPARHDQATTGTLVQDAASWPQGLSIAAAFIADTVRVGQPLRLVYYVRNRGPTALFRHDPLFLVIEVMAPSGRFVEREDLYEPPQLGSRPDVLIPDGGFMGQVIDLRCGSWLFTSSTGSSCAFRYVINEVGTYRVVVHYSAIPPPSKTAEESKPLMLSSDTATVVLMPRQGS